jgi:hypothetical protein
MSSETLEQLKARIKREDEAKEEAFQKRLEEIRESQAEFRAEQEKKELAEEQERQKLHEDLRQKLWRWIDMCDTVFCSALSATNNKPTK